MSETSAGRSDDRAAPGTSAAQRRQVTVLFRDIADDSAHQHQRRYERRLCYQHELEGVCDPVLQADSIAW